MIDLGDASALRERFFRLLGQLMAALTCDDVVVAEALLERMKRVSRHVDKIEEDHDDHYEGPF